MERLQQTLDGARCARDKCAMKAKLLGHVLIAAMGMQVILGALTAGLSAVTTGRQVVLFFFLDSYHFMNAFLDCHQYCHSW